LPPAPIVMRLVFTLIVPPDWFRIARSKFAPTTIQLPLLSVPALMVIAP
jgi:hypothetical protein